MKKLLLLCCLSLVCVFILNAQPNFSGSYGYTVAIQDGQPPKEKTSIPGGLLVLVKLEGNKYRFWLDVLTGPPGYNRGETDGTITFNGDTASFDNTFEGAENACILKFKKTGKKIIINSQSTSFNCGFGNGVNADGVYRWQKQQEVINNQWLKKQYPQATLIKVEKNEIELFRDENATQSFTPKKILLKGDSFLNISETENNIYTEFIAADGSFKHGWIRKGALK